MSELAVAELVMLVLGNKVRELLQRQQNDLDQLLLVVVLLFCIEVGVIENLENELLHRPATLCEHHHLDEVIQFVEILALALSIRIHVL